MTCLGILVVETPSASAARVNPDIVLSPQRRSIHRDVRSVLANDLTLQADATLAPNPDACRTRILADVLCDVYRIKVVRDTRPNATNLVQFFIRWSPAATVPSLGLELVATSDQDVPDLDAFVFTSPSSPALPFKRVGGRTTATPERIFWEATQDHYDLVIRAQLGVVAKYTLDAHLYDDALVSPAELLEELGSITNPLGAPNATTRADAVRDAVTPKVSVPTLALVPAGSDSQIAAIGLGATEQFDPASIGAPRTRATAAALKAPSTLTLILAMVAFPTTILGALAFVFVRRRRAQFVS